MFAQYINGEKKKYVQFLLPVSICDAAAFKRLVMLTVK